MEEWMKEMQKNRDRTKKIKELAMSVLSDMTSLEITFNEYEYLKKYMDNQIKSSKIVI